MLSASFALTIITMIHFECCDPSRPIKVLDPLETQVNVIVVTMVLDTLQIRGRAPSNAAGPPIVRSQKYQSLPR